MKTLSTSALAVIDHYVHFSASPSMTGSHAVAAVPYFNNKTVRARAALRAAAGKGAPREIYEEALTRAVRGRIDLASLADESWKKFLVDENLGIDCSGFVYHVLDAESRERGSGALDRHLSFARGRGFVDRVRCYLRPAENTSVAVFADDRNSAIIPVRSVEPGDIIVMTGGSEPDVARDERDHILVVTRVDYQNAVPVVLGYAHAVSYPEDGLYGSGVREGSIGILDPDADLLKAQWTEGKASGPTNRILARALKSKTELRRLKWW